jgi:type I restriction enzyme S subunit
MKTNLLQKNIPEGWEIKKIKDLLDFEQPTKYIVESSSYTPDGKTPVLTANKSFVLGYTNETDGVHKNIPVIIFDDFTTDSKYVDFPFKVKSSAIKILTNRDKNTNLKFVYEIMKSFTFPIANHKRHYISQYQELDIVVPLIKEQQKIADILASVENQIAKIEDLILSTEKLKTGLVANLLSGQIKSRRIKIAEIAEVTSSKRVMVKDYVEDGIPFYRSTEIIKRSKNIPIVSPLYISIEKFNEFKNKFGAPEQGDILVTAVGTIGDIYLVQKGDIFYFKDGNSVWIRKISKIILSEYLKSVLASKYYRDKLNLVAGGSSQKALTIQKLENVKIPLPSTQEQERIVKVLSSVDHKIILLKLLKNNLAKLKKGLVSDLLSGKVRTKQ